MVGIVLLHENRDITIKLLRHQKNRDELDCGGTKTEQNLIQCFVDQFNNPAIKVDEPEDLDTLTNMSQDHPNQEVGLEIPEVDCKWWHKCWHHVLNKYCGVVVNFKKHATGGGGAEPKYME